MRKFIELLGIGVTMLLAAGAALISLLYSPAIMWVVSFAIILLSPAISYIDSARLRMAVCAIFSFMINFNYVIHIPYGRPVFVTAFYGAVLFIFIFAMLYVSSHLSNALKRSEASADMD